MDQEKITWTADGDLRLKAVTDGAEEIFSLMGRAMGRAGIPGRLVAHPEFITFSGQSLDGWTFETDPNVKDGYSIHHGEPQVQWDLNLRGITFRREPLIIN